jgi:broad specificity phosphatase PhoE
VREALDELTEVARTSKVVVVTHVSPLKAGVAWALGVGDEIAWRLFVSPASVSRIDVSRGRPSLVSFNELSHLA